VRVPWSWLRAWVPVPATAQEVASRLTLQGVTVEAVEWAGEGLSGAYAATVVGVDAHPHADHLWVVTVHTGGAEVTVVTGAPGLRPGDRVPWMEVGGRLPSGSKLERRVVRGVASEGMLLSAAEMGLGPEDDRIYRLDASVSPGTDLCQALGLPEAVLVLDLTPNVAVHSQSVRGVAREVAAAYGVGMAAVHPQVPPVGPFPVQAWAEDPQDAPLYALGWAEGEDLGQREAPFLLRHRLLLAGQRPRSLAVDVTNYVLWEWGQPLHAFDADQLRGARVGVRRARPGERLVTLDGVERILGPEQLVIADGEGPVGLAGVMGGQNSQVTPQTQRVALEAAWFRPQAVRRSGRGVGLLTDAQARFEKGVDPEGVLPALGYALDLLAQAGVRTGGYRAQVGEPPPGAREAVLRLSRLALLLGMEVSPGEAEQALSRLGFGVAFQRDGSWRVRIPSWRGDVEGEADLVEEVGRMVGYERLPSRSLSTPPTLPPAHPRRLQEEGMVDYLVAQGFTEVATTSLVSPGEVEALGLAPSSLLSLANPLRTDASVLRPCLLPGLLRVLKANQEWGKERVWVCERGTVFAPPLGPGEFAREARRLAALAYGPRQEEDWRTPRALPDFFTLKGVLVGWLEDTVGREGEAYTFVPGAGEEPPWRDSLHPGRSARVVDRHGRTLAVLGELHPRLAARLELEGPVLYWEWLWGEAMEGEVRRPLGRWGVHLPWVARDLAAVVPDEVAALEVVRAIRQAGRPYLEDVRLFDVYRGSPVPPGARSLAFHLRYRAQDRTLTEAEVEPVHQAVREAVRALGAQLRS
jgi:phenylalanyl-tRNA synthetase beta chain